MSARNRIQTAFPSIDPRFSITSPTDDNYNCIAWAAEDESRWWWPAQDAYWPLSGVYSPSLDEFIKAFALLGFKKCKSHKYKSGVKKLAIYVSQNGMVTHMARQLDDGSWSSKLGEGWDISHVSLECLNGNMYGQFCTVISRKVSLRAYLWGLLKDVSGFIRKMRTL